MFERILIVVDGSAASVRAARFAIIMAKETGAEIYAISVVDTATIHELELSRIFVEEEGHEYERSLEEDAKKNLHHVAGLAESKKCRIETVLERGSVYGRIVEFAMEKKIDLIVIGGDVGQDRGGTRNRASLEYLRVLRESRQSVLFVKDPGVDVNFKKL
jgi:nucleotide-binding universal stress UspA family protein